MPTYRYKCQRCGTYTERGYRMGTAPPSIEAPCCAPTDAIAYSVKVPFPVQTTFKHADSTAYKGRKRSTPVRKPGEG
jgi:predicted nucleic acid-binding Zn ribbon protein